MCRACPSACCQIYIESAFSDDGLYHVSLASSWLVLPDIGMCVHIYIHTHLDMHIHIGIHIQIHIQIQIHIHIHNT